MSTRVRRTAGSWTAAVIAAAVLAAASAVSLAAPAAAAPPVVTAVGTVGQSGHAQLYGWGLAADPTDPAGSVLVGDYWNFRVARYAKDGTFLRDLVTTANKGSANNEDPAPELHQSPYGLAVDPVTGDFYFGDVDGGKTVDKYDRDGNFLLAFGGNGANVANKFRYPSRLAVGPDRRVYVADQWDHFVSVHDPSGKELFAFGGNGTADGKFRQPRGLAFDAQNRLFVVDDYNHRVQVFDQEGRFLFKFGSKGDQPGQFAAGADMRGLAIDTANGWVYVVDAASGYVNKFDTTGRFLTRWGGFGSAPGKFAGGGREVTVDLEGNVWVADMPGFRVQKFTPDGAFLAVVPDPASPPPLGGFNQPRGVALDAQGRIFVSDTHNFRIQRFGADGRPEKEWGHRGGTGLGFNYQRGIAVDRRTGDVVVADTDNHKIAKFTGDGVLKWEVGGFGTVLGKFTNPHGVDVSPVDGKIYVADTQNGRVVVLDEHGTALSAFGFKGTGKGQFQFNRDVVVDPADQSLWVSDSQRGKVQHFSSSGAYLGEFGALGSADHQLKRAADVQVHGDNVYVADVDTHRIKVWSKTGQFRMAFGGGGSGPGQMFNPHGMDVTPDGLLYVAEQTGERISVFRLQDADTTAADTTIEQPATGAELTAGTVTVAGSATDDRGVTRVAVAVKDEGSARWWDGGSWVTSPAAVLATLATGAQQTGWSLAVPSVSAGSYTVTAAAEDAAANKDTTPATTAFSVTGQAVDTVAPDGTIAYPTAKRTIPSGPVEFRGAATDNVAVTDVRVAIQDSVTKTWWNGTGWATGITWLPGVSLSAPGAPSLSWSYRWMPPSAGGTFGVTVRAADASGNLDPTRPFVGFTSPGYSDTSPADTAISSPSDGAVVPAGEVALAGSAMDDLAVAGVRVAVQDLGTGQWWSGSGWVTDRAWREAAVSGTGSPSGTWSSAFTALSSGEYAVHAEARDSAGNADPEPARATVTVEGSVPDTVAPDGAVTVPSRLQVFPAGRVPFSGGATDNVGVTAVKVGIQNASTKRWWDGSTWVTGNGWYLTAALATTSGSTTWTYDWTAPTGSYSVTVRAEDAAGNVDSTRPFVNFTVD